MKHRSAIVLCLGFSGLTALVYQIVWTRLLGFAFGTTTEAIASVLAVFFGGLALGNLIAARWLARAESPTPGPNPQGGEHAPRLTYPLRVYALLELAIGIFALVSLPLLQRLPAVHAWLGVAESPLALTALRLAVAAVVLLPPTIAMGATLPVVARGLVTRDETRGRWSALLYAANTFGAVVGAYLCGFWLIPELGLTRAVVAAGTVNVGVAAAVLAVAHRMPVRPAQSVPSQAGDASGIGRRGAFLGFFCVSGFVAIGYEIVWSKIFGIVMEGTLYGFATVLSAYLLGVGLGSLAIAPRVDRIRDLPRAFGLLHAAIAAAVIAGTATMPYLPYAYQRLVDVAAGGDAVHWLFVLVLPVLLVPTALFGAAFPILIRIYAQDAGSVGQGMGLATAVNTAGSIAASLIVGFWWIPSLGMDAALYLLVVLDLAVAVCVLTAWSSAEGPSRLVRLVGSTCVAATLVLSYNGVHVEEAIAGRQIPASNLADYRDGLAWAERSRALTIQGKSSIVSVYTSETDRLLRTNGMPEAGFSYAPPFYPLEAVALGLVPYLLAPAEPDRALVIGFGGGNTVSALLQTDVSSIEVVELEEGVIEAAQVMHAGRPNPLDDPRVALRIGDGRNDLLRTTLRGRAGYPLIASQPSHPWRVGAANLFTEDFFRIAHDALAAEGVFALWVNGFRTDPQALIAIAASFERVFPGSLLFDIGGTARSAFLLLGGRAPLRLDLETLARRFARPATRELLSRYDLHTPEDLLARIEGPGAVFAALTPGASNTDDNAFVETRVPRRLDWAMLDFDAIEARVPSHAPLLPPSTTPYDLPAVARALLRSHEGPGWPYTAKVERFLDERGDGLSPLLAGTLRATALARRASSEPEGVAALRDLAAEYAEAPEPLRRLGAHLLARRGGEHAAAGVFAEAFARSGEARDAYDAGRALHRVDPEASWQYFARIPQDARSQFPRLVVYTAERAVARREERATLRVHYANVRSFAMTAEGADANGVQELLARLASSVDDRSGARAHADADAAERERRARPVIARARAALARGDLEHARRALNEAAVLRPGDSELATLHARLALASGDRVALDTALLELRAWAPSLEAGIAAENRFRSRHGLPLLPERPIEVLAESLATPAN